MPKTKTAEPKNQTDIAHLCQSAFDAAQKKLPPGAHAIVIVHAQIDGRTQATLSARGNPSQVVALLNHSIESVDKWSVARN